ncbi:general secretion pathway protein GspB, partial [Paracidovorax sp. MALMAid1276]|uniref:general secretion pathway protein GspB n=1 Tax=Paracidovorax sp. MALMAid1276 TaxID=3411631 RepID=UPI003B9C96B6
RAPAPPPPAARAPEPATPTGTVFAQSDLPDAVRAQLPVLKISGASYSTNANYRMAIVNGQVLHEGDLAAPGLMLEKIEPGRTIWSFKGYRYGLASQ